ncbi:uncharacterized protein MELLADRAFT_103698 [Melampsora larici-populina 98AG31]|uniref:Shugoshin C-terminal domain-containing protein n=1 Tax=Melampsora larici-populina (strain 98AG31 / pathotype 3-4-7) TaxID=747676 RepID=F4RCN6_MELLP|nr:uncharacterized protein MELLADRAFT_103698 [Melampsora larici-populina 98AG31]EGG10016.1 hypothetical protein MELLADRAFT_103698 [Melampsora larici-populina 98AG31]
MPATRSTGPPNSASLQPIIMEAFEHFKQKHSKQNQDLIHKNRLLLKTITELENLITELRNQNISLRLEVTKARRNPSNSTSTSHPSSKSNELPNSSIRLAISDILSRCQFIQSALDSPSTSHHNPTLAEGLFATALTTSQQAYQDDRPHIRIPKPHAELIALRERRRSELASDGAETRLSFIDECSSQDETSTHETRPTDLKATYDLESASSSSSGSDSPARRQASRHAGIDSSFISERSHRRQSILPNMQNEPLVQPSTSIQDEQDQYSSLPPSSNHVPNLAPTQHKVSQRQMFRKSRLKTIPTRDLDSSDAESEENNKSESENDEEMNSSHELARSEAEQSPSPQPSPIHIRTDTRPGKKRRANISISSGFVPAISPEIFSLTSSITNQECVPSIVNLPNLTSGSQERINQKSKSIKTNNRLQVVSETSASRRRDSGLKKDSQADIEERERSDDDDDENESSNPIRNPDEKWPKQKKVTKGKKRARGSLDAVKEETLVPSMKIEESTTENGSAGGSREARRARKEVNYALPSLNKKMRRPEDYVSTVKRASLTTHGLPRGASKSGQRSSSGGSIPSRIKSPTISSSLNSSIGSSKSIKSNKKLDELESNHQEEIDLNKKKNVLQNVEENLFSSNSNRTSTSSSHNRSQNLRRHSGLT